MSPTTQDPTDQDPIDGFLTWLTAHGATLPHLEPRLAESNKGHGLFLTSIPPVVPSKDSDTHDSNEPVSLLTLPARLWFTRKNILRRAFRDAERGDRELVTWLDTVRRYQGQRDEKEDHESSSSDPTLFRISHRATLITCILHARRRPKSFWYPYVRMLPLETVDTPVLWYVEKILERQGLLRPGTLPSQDDPPQCLSENGTTVDEDTGESLLDLLARTEVGRASRAKADRLFKDHRGWTSGSDEDEEGERRSDFRNCLSSTEDSVPFMEYARVDALVGSRALSFDGVEREALIRDSTRSDGSEEINEREHDATQEEAEEESWIDDFDDATTLEEKNLVMLPLVDFCNHSSRPNARWRVHPRNRQVDLILTIPPNSISVGDEISISYGSRSTSEFLFLYGFVPEPDHGPKVFESITLPLPIAFLWAGGEEEADETENDRALVVAKMEFMKSVGLVPRIKILSDFETEQTKLESLQIENATSSPETSEDGLSLDSRRTLWLCSVNQENGIIPSSSSSSPPHLSVLGKPLTTLPDLDQFIRNHPLYPLFRLRSVTFLNSIIDTELESLRLLLLLSGPIAQHRKVLLRRYATETVKFLDRSRERCLRTVETLMTDEKVVTYLREMEDES